jgi:hypothetical protein
MGEERGEEGTTNTKRKGLDELNQVSIDLHACL